ncbi:hypothetical protein MPEAHAMD_7070 [Methylobacterium frigidaeris]|uniref:Uncharacterized protein n=1 Tax=Methylobacterium frigidaeris TaxID=2038277 RepID=A0AA37HJ87_9HYPH|nr:hypothetical protein MPEAHAMD_7070 [Methylobacterium frigidaeris]
MARELAELAFLANQDGHQATAQMFTQICRQRRVKNMELRGTLAVLGISDSEPAGDAE